MKEEKREGGRQEEQMTVKAERVSGLEILPAITHFPCTYRLLSTLSSLLIHLDQLYSIFIYLPVHRHPFSLPLAARRTSTCQADCRRMYSRLFKRRNN